MVDIEPKRETAVREGETLQIRCKVDRPLRVCRVEIPGEKNALLLTPDDPSEDGIQYYGAGLKAGECGVSIAKVKETHDGNFTCSLNPSNTRTEVTASLKIIVASESLCHFFYDTTLRCYLASHLKNNDVIQDVSCVILVRSQEIELFCVQCFF